MKLSSTTIFIFLIIALAGIGLYSYVTISGNSPKQVPPAGDRNVLRKENEAISVAVTYPVVPGTTKGVTSANDYLRSEIQDRVEDFEVEAQESLGRNIELPQDIKSTVVGSSAIEEKNDRYVSIFMGMEWYLRGAAHPSHSIETYVYDYEADKLIALEDMFKPGTDYLKLLSQYSYQDLFMQSKQGDMGFIFDESMVSEGTKPTRENFTRVLPLSDGLMIYFNEYQVAPYAAGAQQVAIPYSKLKDVINPDGVLGSYIQ